jgi:hypothetical protein
MSGLSKLAADISQLPRPRNWAMAGGSNGYRDALVKGQLTPGLISSLPGTAGSPQFISFWTSYPELDSGVRRPKRGIGNSGRVWEHPNFRAGECSTVQATIASTIMDLTQAKTGHAK